MRFQPLFVLVAISVLPASILCAQTSQSSEPIGRVTAAFGVARVESPDGVHKGDLNTLITNGDRVRTNGGGVTVLLASRVVLKIDHDTTITLSDSADQLNVILEKGTVHVFVGDRPLAAGAVAVQDPQVRAETTKGVFLASYDPQTKSGYYACEHATLNVQSGDGSQKVTLAPDKQIVVEAGRFAAEEDLDRLVFNERKVSLERLGQAAKEHGAETFRLRSRMFDTQLAINQLSEAGWIDANTLQTQAQQKAAKKGKKGTATSDDKSGEGDEKSEEPDEPSKTLKEEPAQPSKPAPSEPAPSEPAPAEPVLTENTPDETPAEMPGQVEQPAAVAAVNTDAPAPVSVEAPPVVEIDVEPVRERPGNGQGNAFGLDKQPEGDVKAQKHEGPKHNGFRFEDHPGKGNDNGNGHGKDREPVTPAPANEAPLPADDIDVPSERPTPAPVTPKIDLDLDLPQDNKAAAPAPGKFDLNLDHGGGRPAPKFNDSAAPAPRLDLDQKGASPPKVDLGGGTKGGKFNSSGPGGGAPKMDKATPAPRLDLGGATPAPKVDLGGSTPTPKIDLGGATPAPKIDLGGATPAPKIDLGGATPAPKIDLGGATPAPKVDLGGATPAPKIDLGNAAPTPKLNLSDAAPAPKIDVAKPAGELPSKIDLGGDIAAPKLDLAPKGDTIAPPTLGDVTPKGVTDAVATPTGDLKPNDLKLDAPTKIDVPTDLAKDAAPGTDLPTPKDLGVDVTDVGDVTGDAVKDATKEVTKKLSKEERRRRHRDRKPATPPPAAPAAPPPDTTATPPPSGTPG
jgi:hypothetical protein